MIVPMKKVSLIIMGEERSEALTKLRSLGLLHIEIGSASGGRTAELKEQIALLESGIYSIGKRKVSVAESISVAEALAVAGELSELEARKNAYRSELISLGAELDRLSGWGDIDPAEINGLKARGIDVSLYEMPSSEYSRLCDGTDIICLGRTKTAVKCMVALTSDSDSGEKLSELAPYRLTLPQCSTAEMRDRSLELTKSIETATEKAESYAVYAEGMRDAVSALEKELEFETYAVGMASERLSDSADGTSVAYFTGYIEASELGTLKRAAKENSWGLLAEEPCETDDVPTKLRNNRFVSLIYPLTDFLGTVPGYFEYDISAWFLAFILIFFGIIFGDGGYGLLITAAAAVPIIHSLLSKKKPSPTFLLIGLFGLSTIVWGTLTCTWFGLSPEHLPQWLKSLSVPLISNVYADRIWSPFWVENGVGLTTAQNLQIFCFTLALIQLSVAHFKCAVRNKCSLKLIGDIGSVLQLVGMYYVVLSLVVNAEVFGFGLVIYGVPIGTVAVALIVLGFVMSFVFANYEGSLIRSVLASLVNIVSVLLGVVNVFSDIVSYIRLWAVGLAGAAISATVNELAGPLLGNFMFIVIAIVLLVFGHGLNMILNVLSVIVHGIRLNTLEFSSHLDMSWSGRKFKPFKE